MSSDKTIKEYQEICKKEFGKEIAEAQAREEGERLVGLVKAVYGPITNALAKKLINKNK